MAMQQMTRTDKMTRSDLEVAAPTCAYADSCCTSCGVRRWSRGYPSTIFPRTAGGSGKGKCSGLESRPFQRAGGSAMQSGSAMQALARIYAMPCSPSPWSSDGQQGEEDCVAAIFYAHAIQQLEQESSIWGPMGLQRLSPGPQGPQRLTPNPRWPNPRWSNPRWSNPKLVEPRYPRWEIDYFVI